MSHECAALQEALVCSGANQDEFDGRKPICVCNNNVAGQIFPCKHWHYLELNSQTDEQIRRRLRRQRVKVHLCVNDASFLRTSPAVIFPANRDINLEKQRAEY